MRAHFPIRPALILPLLAAAGLHCDFPPDPPLKDDSKPDRLEMQIDSARTLLPLRTGNIWLYTVVPKIGTPQPLLMAWAVETTYDGVVYYELKYLYYPASGVEAPMEAFPVVLRPHKGGLSFYEPLMPSDTASVRTPRPVYTLPYPAPLGSRTEVQRSDFAVRVAAKDTVISNYKGNAQFACYRYDITHRGRRHCTIYAVPGSALIRIEYENLTFHTTDWAVQ